MISILLISDSVFLEFRSFFAESRCATEVNFCCRNLNIFVAGFISLEVITSA